MKLRYCYLSIVIICLAACGNPRGDETLFSKPVPYSVVSRSALFNDKHISFTLDSLSSTLYINLNLKDLQKFPFPVSKRSGDTLFKTVFNFDLYCNGKLIGSDYKNLHNPSRENDTTGNALNLSLSTDTINLKQATSISFQIPFYAFHTLKKGKQTIELNMSQSVFTDEVRIETDTSADYVHVYENRPLLNARVKFDLNIPPVYKSIVYGYGLELRNDSAFSPAGMDNTIWKSSYPDIYWMLYYPTTAFYTQTFYETSTASYVGHDTFNLYHYYLNDSIGIGVYDHDNLSKDDGLGSWTGALQKLAGRPLNRLTFGYVKAFDVKVESKGLVN